MKRLILVRHGETRWNAEDRLQGQQDVPLNETGIQQADRIARALVDESLDVIYTSDLSRAAETAARIAAPHGLAPVPDARLRQSSKGHWEGLTWGEIAEQFPADLERWQRDQTYLPPGGETTAHYLARLRDFFDDVAQAHPNQTVVAVSHGHVSRMLICRALGLDFALAGLFTIGNAALVDLSFANGRGRLVRMNADCYLEKET
jgi:probable phosphoglycerate mutase